MPDRTPDRTGPDVDRTTIAAAAVRLGISTDAVRKRLHRGQLVGEKQAGVWVVFLPPLETSQAKSPDRIESTPGPDSDRTATGPDRIVFAANTAQSEAVAAMRETIEVLRSDVAYLRDQLDHSRRELAAERERFDVLHREALGRIPALAAGEDALNKSLKNQGEATPDARPADTSQAVSGDRRRSWWRFWGHR